MRTICTASVLLLTIWLTPTVSHNPKHALFVKRDILGTGKRVVRQTSADQMVQNILHWLQDVYSQNSRTIRQGTLREYLPPPNTQKPRPFQTVAPQNGGYPPAGQLPQPPFTIEGYPSFEPPVEHPDFTNYPGTKITSPSPTTGYPNTGYSSSVGTTKYPNSGTTSSSNTNGYPTNSPTNDQNTNSPTNGQNTNSPTNGQNTNSPTNGQNTNPPTNDQNTNSPTNSYSPTNSPTNGYPTNLVTDAPSNSPSSSSNNIPDATGATSSIINPTIAPETFPTVPPIQETQPPFTSKSSTIPTIPTTISDDVNSIPPSGRQTTTTEDHKGIESAVTTAIVPPNDDLRHPPHIHAIDVECSKEMMTINIEFNRQFDGIIYSKGYFNNPECRYVMENSGQTKYTIKVSLNSCGTEFINAFDTQGKSYLENVLVLQNEPGIQEIWDTVRSVRCLWEGNLKKALNVALSVGMLNQEIVTFSGDTAMTRLDVQLGKGPFAPPATGLIKIGEVMTLVVSVTGDPGFDIQVKDCKAKDASGNNVVSLTDNRGCVLKPKLFGSFQKTRDTGTSGASIISYAFFNAFKFPDVMDLTLECNVDLCKTDCEECPDPNQKIDPARRRKRDLYSQNATIDSSVTMEKAIRVILPEDVSDGKTIINFDHYEEAICMSNAGFTLSIAVLIFLLSASCLFSAYIWLKYQRLNLLKIGS